MSFRSFDNLKTFDVIARHMSLTQAADELHLSKGALSYQVKKLEQELGFKVFDRINNKIKLTIKGKSLLLTTREALKSLEEEITHLREADSPHITIGMSTYFASRWLTPRLMKFTSVNTNIGLRIQPTMGLATPGDSGLDMVIRWGDGTWQDLQHELLFNCPAMATAGKSLAKKFKQFGLQDTLAATTLLHDFEGSTSWAQWHTLAGLNLCDSVETLVIPDPNVRVQAVINGQGMALNDFLVSDEINRGNLIQISEVELSDYGYYLAYQSDAMQNPYLKSFRDWLIKESVQ